MLPLMIPLSLILLITHFYVRRFDRLNDLRFCRSLSPSKGRLVSITHLHSFAHFLVTFHYDNISGFQAFTNDNAIA